MATARSIPLLATLSVLQNHIESMGPSAVVAYPLLYALCNLLLLPAGILSILGGFFFGLWWGFAVVLTGNLLAATAAFSISRFLARSWLEPRIHASKRLHAIDEAISREGWKIVFLSQLHPLFPTSLLNYVYGVSKIRFSQCLLWIALGQTPGLFLYAYLGTLGQHGLDLLLGNKRPATFEYFLWISGLLLAFAVAWILGRIALDAMRRSEQHGGN